MSKFILRFTISILSGVIILILNTSLYAQESKKDFEIVKYNNPNLVVDLGVGLWAWPLPVDYDNDGDMDLMVSSQGKPYNGIFYFENKSGDKFPVFAKPIRLYQSIRDIQLSYVNGKPRYTIPGAELLNFKQTFDKEKKAIFPVDSILKDIKGRKRFNQWRLVDYDNDGDEDAIAGVDEWFDYGWDGGYTEKGKWKKGPLHGYVYLIENVNGTYTNKGRIKANGKNIDLYGAPTPNFEDFDGDGDLDLICGEFVDKLTYFENTGTREKPAYTEGRYLSNKKGIIKMDLEMIIPIAVDWDKDGDIDLIVGDEDGRVALVENTGKVKNKMPVFNSPKYFKQEADDVKFGALITPYSVDIDNDGDEDIIAGNSAGYIGFIENLGIFNGKPRWADTKLLKSNGKVIRIQAGENGSIQGPAEAKWGYTTLSVADWDNDGLKDLIVNSIWGKVVWYKNTGSKTKPKFTTEQAVEVNWKSNYEPSPGWNWWKAKQNTLVTQWRTTPLVVDWNKDGKNDIIMLDKDGYLAYFEREPTLSLKHPQRIFYADDFSGYDQFNVMKDSIPGLLKLNIGKSGSSGRRKFTITDWDLDGKPDILVNSLNITLLKNIGIRDGVHHFKNRGTLSNSVLAGHDTSPTVVDWNKDNIPDLLVGAEDGHLYYLLNQNKPQK